MDEEEILKHDKKNLGGSMRLGSYKSKLKIQKSLKSIKNGNQ